MSRRKTPRNSTRGQGASKDDAAPGSEKDGETEAAGGTGPRNEAETGTGATEQRDETAADESGATTTASTESTDAPAGPAEDTGRTGDGAGEEPGEGDAPSQTTKRGPEEPEAGSAGEPEAEAADASSSAAGEQATASGRSEGDESVTLAETDGPGEQPAAAEPLAGTDAGQGEVSRRERGEEPPVHDDHAELHPEDEPEGAGPAAVLLWMLIAAIAAGAGALWAAPKIAPHVPAPVARYLMPPQEDRGAEIAALESRVSELRSVVDERVGALRADLDALSGAVPEGAELATAAELTDLRQRLGSAAETASDAASRANAARDAAETAGAAAKDAAGTAEAAQSRAAGNAETLAALESRVADIDERVVSLSNELNAVSDALAETPATDGEGTPRPELSAAVQALRARIETLENARAADPDYLPQAEAETFARQEAIAELRSAVDRQAGALEAEIGRLEDRVAAAESDLATALESVREDLSGTVGDVRSTLSGDLSALSERVAELSGQVTEASEQSAAAIAEAERAVRKAALEGASEALSAQVAGGRPYARALSEYQALSGREAPEALATHAGTGLATADELARRLTEAARAAVKASASADGGTGSRLQAWLSSQVSGRPTEELEGDSVDARLSRIQARVEDGALAKALSEAEALPEAAAAAMADWTAALRRRVAAERALERYLDGKTAG